MKALSELGISPAPWKADMSFVSSSDGNVCLTVGNEIEMDDKERANARLIAAAPELYEALRGLLEWRGLRGGDIEEKVETAKEFCSRIAKARAAIAKASGQEVANNG